MAIRIFAESDRLILRELLEKDQEGMYELDSDPLVHRYLGNKTIKTREEALAVIGMVRKQYDENGIGRWAVINKSTEEFMGWAGLKLVKDKADRLPEYYDMGYRLIPRFWGQGIASECAVISTDYAFEQLNLDILYASAHTGNLASNRIIVKTGFKFVEEYTWETLPVNWYEYRREDWNKRA